MSHSCRDPPEISRVIKPGNLEIPELNDYKWRFECENHRTNWWIFQQAMFHYQRLVASTDPKAESNVDIMELCEV
jgi:hypothetical protein